MLFGLELILILLWVMLVRDIAVRLKALRRQSGLGDDDSGWELGTTIKETFRPVPSVQLSAAWTWTHGVHPRYYVTGDADFLLKVVTEDLGAYERLMRPFIAEKQKAAKGFAGAFAPKSEFALFLRNQISKVLSVPFIAHLAIGRGLEDRLELPDYGDG